MLSDLLLVGLCLIWGDGPGMLPVPLLGHSWLFYGPEGQGGNLSALVFGEGNCDRLNEEMGSIPGGPRCLGGS